MLTVLVTLNSASSSPFLKALATLFSPSPENINHNGNTTLCNCTHAHNFNINFILHVEEKRYFINLHGLMESEVQEIPI